MTTSDLVAYVIVPLVLFVLGASGTAIVGLVKGTAYMARSQVAQESTAKTNAEMNATLKQFIEQTDNRLNDHAIELARHDTRLTIHDGEIRALKNGSSAY